ncbi:MAG: MATE family efflux transporter [Rhodobacteraceae bacterium]|nr:MATE family efflux transporter [Paracoccaceae bacterium]
MLQRLVGHWRALFALAWPVMLSRAGVLVMAMTSVVMVGRYDTLALAQLSLGYAIFIPVLVAGIGCLVGVVSVTSRATGAGVADLPAVALRGLWWAACVGALATLPILAGGSILRAIGQAPELAAGGGAVARMLAAGAFFQIVFVGASFYLEGTARTKPGLVAMAAGNVVNLGLNWLLIGGNWGAPAMGAEGAALGSTLARAVMCAGLVIWMLRLPEFAAHRASPRRLWGPGGWAAGVEMRRIGLAGGAAYFFETFAFASLAQAAGLLGTTALAAYTILHNIEATVFMIALGLSVATAVRVGQAVGAGDRRETRIIALAGLTAAMALIGGIGLALLAFAPWVAGFYSRDPVLLARATPLFAILAVTMIFDAGQVVMGQSTRAMGDGWGTTRAFFVAFWLVMIPASLALAFLTPLAEAGLFLGTGVGCAAALILLGRRFLWLLDRPPA